MTECRVRESLERLHEHMRKDLKTNSRCREIRLTRPVREKVCLENLNDHKHSDCLSDKLHDIPRHRPTFKCQSQNSEDT
jgi:hypothetical protein